MRILYLTKLPPLQGGMSTRGWHLAGEFARRGHEVAVVTDVLHAAPHERVPGGTGPVAARLPDRVRLYWTESGRHRLYLHHPGGRDAMAHVASVALAAAEEHPPDVVLSAYLEPYGLSGHLVARELGLPHVVMHAGSDVGRLMRARDHQHLYARVLAGAAVVLTTPHHRPALTDLGLSRDRLVALPVPLPPWAGEPYRPPEGRRVVFLGKLGHPDHVEDLFRRCDAAGLDLRVIGQPAYPDHWRPSGAEAGRLRPFVWPWQVPGELRDAAAVLATEPDAVEIPGHLGLKAVEAAAAGRPVVVPRRLTDNYRLPAAAVVGGLAELSDLLADPHRTAAAGRAGHDWAAGKLAGDDPTIVSFAAFTDRIEAVLAAPPTVAARGTGVAPVAAPVLAVATDLAYGEPVDPAMTVCRRLPLWLTAGGDGRTTVLAGGAGVHRREFRLEEPYVRLLDAADGTRTWGELAGDDAGRSRLRTLLAHDLLSLTSPGSPPPQPPPLVRPDRPAARRPAPAAVTARYERDGYLVGVRRLDATLLAAVRAELAALLDRRPGEATVDSAALVSSWQEVAGRPRPRRVNALWETGPASAALVTADAVTDLAAAAAPGVELAYLSEQLLVKWPGPESELRWHRDPGAPLGPDAGLDFVVGVHFGDGLLEVLPGSHRRPESEVPSVPAAEVLSVPLAPGLVTLHSRSLLHRSPAHRGSTPRCSVYVHFVPIDVAAGQLGRATSVRRHQELTGVVRP